MEIIRIGEKHYDASKLTEAATTLLNDIAKIDGEMNRLSLQSSIMNLAKGTLVEKLVAETSTLTDAEVEAPSEAAAE
jgi:hypothetical protein